MAIFSSRNVVESNFIDWMVTIDPPGARQMYLSFHRFEIFQHKDKILTLFRATYRVPKHASKCDKENV